MEGIVKRKEGKKLRVENRKEVPNRKRIETE